MDMRNEDARPATPLWRNTADRLYLLNDVLLVGDIIAGTTIGYFSVGLYFRLAWHLTAIPPLGMMVWRELVLVSVITALVIRKSDYRPDSDPVDLAPVVASILGRALCAGVTLLSIGLVTGALHEVARLWILPWAALFLTWMMASRLLLLCYRRGLMACGALRQAIAIMGPPATTAGLANQLQAEADIIGVFDHCNGDVIDAVSASIVNLARSGAIGLVVLAVGPDEPAERISLIVDHLKAAPIPVAVRTDLAGLTAASHEIRTLAGVAMTLVADRPLNRRDLVTKSMMDKLGASILITLATPLFAAIALAILLETRGPVIFRQSRTGWCGRQFTIYKFRSMGHNPGEPAPSQTSRGDPRCTRIGRLLRRTSLDELPQLWNVLTGDMSLVGPRPHADFLHARECVDGCPLEEYAQRQRVKPGLTGWAQVHGFRGAADTPEKLRRRVELDLYYIENWSIWLDLQILARTPWVVLSAENAF
jgi:putative colanic acid biosynthesis UDP-glucose lipid carrier transferase